MAIPACLLSTDQKKQPHRLPFFHVNQDALKKVTVTGRNCRDEPKEARRPVTVTWQFKAPMPFQKCQAFVKASTYAKMSTSYEGVVEIDEY